MADKLNTAGTPHRLVVFAGSDNARAHGDLLRQSDAFLRTSTGF